MMDRKMEELVNRDQSIAVRFVTKAMAGGSFGRCFRSLRVIWIREDLPVAAQQFVYWHEIHHLTDEPDDGFFQVEWEANWYGVWHCPLGALVVLWLTVTSRERWKLYFRLVRQAVQKMLDSRFRGKD